MSQKVLDDSKKLRYPQQPHGGELVNQVLAGEELEAALQGELFTNDYGGLGSRHYIRNDCDRGLIAK